MADLKIPDVDRVVTNAAFKTKMPTVLTKC